MLTMEYARPKLHINRYKKHPPHILFRKIAQEIDHETQTKLNFSFDYDLSLWLIRLMSLNPKYKISTIHLFDRTAVNALIKDYLQIVSDPDHLFVAIVKMQIYYLDYCIDKNQIIARHQAGLNEKMKPLTRLIINTRLKSKKECDKYLIKLAVDIIAHYALGNPENTQVVEETINALKSMMSTNDVIAFSTLCEKDKIESLSGIREIVCGMRAFNKDAGHCSEGLVDIEKTIRNGYKTTQLQLSASLQEISSRIQSLMGPLGKLVAPDIHCWLIENNNAIKSITLYRQCERFLHDLLITLTDHQIYIDRCLKGFRSQLNKIHETVKFRTAIPITSIFPKFIELAKLWEQLQHQTYILSEINTVNGQLMFLAQNQSYNGIVRDLEMALTTSPSPNYGSNNGDNVDCASQKVAAPKIMDASNNEPIQIVPYDGKLKVEYEAFCTWTISIVEGLLMAADLSIGLVHYKNRYYAFSRIDAADSFVQNPDICLHRITELICRNPELVIFFDMYDLLEQHGISTTQVAFSSDQNEVNSLEKCSVGVQTDVHPIPYSKCTDHTWNVWDLRRMAIKLADIQKCKTKSTQTFCHSSFGTQTHF